jgi:hypothetical protein
MVKQKGQVTFMMRRAAHWATMLLLVAGVLLGGRAPLLAEETPAVSETQGSRESIVSPGSVMASLERALAWYQEARVVVSSTRGVLEVGLTQSEEQTALRALQRAFDTARARATLLAQDGRPDSPRASPRGSQADRRTKLLAAIEQDERDVARLRVRLRGATAAARPALERELAAASNRRELDKAQLDFVTKLRQLDSAAQDDEPDLPQQIRALQDAVPELTGSSAAPTVVTSPPRTGSPSGPWALVYRLIALQHSRSSLRDLTRSTNELARDIDGELQVTQQAIRPALARLRTLAQDPVANGTPLATGQQEFRDLLERVKLLGAVTLPLREQSALVHRYAGDVEGWGRAVNHETAQVLRGLGLQLVGVGIALGVIFVGSVVWRVAVMRYVANVYYRRLLLTARHVVVAGAVVLVLVFHFTTELTALVAVLGVAAAGIAFALQTVILAVAGYFSMVAPNGIRVRDRVSLQGPFGYVHGEVIEIGVVRTRLQELAGDPLRPTGRIMVFPNSVVFTGSFIKHPPPDARPA